MKQKMNLANVFSSRVGVDVNVKNKTTFKNDKHDYNFVFFFPDKLCRYKYMVWYMCVFM